MNDLIILYDDAASLSTLSPAQFAMIRRQGFGASDAASLLGVSPYTTREQLIEQKASPTISEDELKIGTLPAVKAGVDLEPHILMRFEERFNVAVAKPKPMYNIPNTKLNVNFDGIFLRNEQHIPVECKYVSPYGGKYYNLGAAILDIHRAIPQRVGISPTETIAEHITRLAYECGIPGYYYTQMQQQILAADAPYGYLTCLISKTWDYHTFLIPRDLLVIDALLTASALTWVEVERLRKRGKI